MCCAFVLVAACSQDEGSPVVEPPAAETNYGATDAPADTGAAIQATDCEDRRSGPQALIEIEDFRFVPTCVQMTTSQGFQLKNNGENLHNFSVEGVSGIDLDISSGQENNTENPGLNADIYTYFCKYHRGRGMEGELKVASG